MWTCCVCTHLRALRRGVVLIHVFATISCPKQKPESDYEYRSELLYWPAAPSAVKTRENEFHVDFPLSVYVRLETLFVKTAIAREIKERH